MANSYLQNNIFLVFRSYSLGGQVEQSKDSKHCHKSYQGKTLSEFSCRDSPIDFQSALCLPRYFENKLKILQGLELFRVLNFRSG